MTTTRGTSGRKAGTIPAAQPSVAKSPNEALNIDNSAADIIGGSTDDGALENAQLGAELPPIPGDIPGTGDVAPVPDAGAATNAQVGAELPPPAQAFPTPPITPPPAGLAEAPLNIPDDVTRVGTAPQATDNAGNPVVNDEEGTPLNKKAKYTDKSVWKPGVQAEVREAVMSGKLVRKMTGEGGAPVYRFYH